MSFRYLKPSLALLLAATAVVLPAQDLDTVNVADQFSTGDRSALANGAAFTAADVTGSINYYTTFGGGSGTANPVLDVTVSQPTDGAGPTPAVTGNTTDGFSTSPNFALFVGDAGGGQNLVFGEENDANYFIRAAVYAEPRTVAGTAPQFERPYIAARVPSLVGTTFNTASNVDAIGGYGLYYETDTATFLAVKMHPNRVAADLSGAAAGARDAVAREVFATSAPITVGGWHIIEISCFNQQITFKLDGNTMITVTDTKYAAGQAALAYRELFTPTAPNEYQARFDYVVAGPSTAPPVPAAAGSWNLYE